MKTIYNFGIIFQLITLFLLPHFALTQTQETAISFEIDTVHPGNQTYDYTARDYIKLLPDFNYNAESGNTFVGRIDETLIFDATDNEELNPYDREIKNPAYSVGTTPMSINVSPTGAATCQIPIYIPTGTAGMQPNLSVVYNSQTGDGILGVGWNIAGLSAIVRIPQTVYHDGQIRGVKLDDNDRFALNGNRLITISATEYRTEIDEFVKVTSYGNYNNTGPEWFKVETKDGRTLEFGNTSDSRIITNSADIDAVLQWRINKVYDRNNNYIEYKYETDDGETRITEINYTKNDDFGLQPYNKIKFLYSNKSNSKNIIYINSSKITLKSLLRSIVIISDDINLVKKYELKYSYDFYWHLTEVIEYGSDGKELNSTIINWKPVSDPFDNKDVTPVMRYSNDCGNTLFWFGDFNGDGKVDVFSVPPKLCNEGEPNDCDECHLDYQPSQEWSVYFSESTTSAQFSSPVTGNLFWRFQPEYTRIGDFNGDGMDDIFLVKKTTNCHYSVCDINAYIIFSNGTSFEQKKLIEQLSGSIILNMNTIPFVTDYDGDKKDEIHFMTKIDNLIYAHLEVQEYNNISSSTVTPTLLVSYDNFSFFTFQPYKIIIRDFNGDGKTDIIAVGDKTNIYELTGSSFTTICSELGFPTRWHDIYPGDFNGDGKTDLLTFTSDNKWHLNYGTGSGFSWPEVSDSDLPLIKDPSNTENNYYIGDFNGDGKSDIFEFFKQSSDATKLYIHYSKGLESIDKPIFESENKTLPLTVGFYGYIDRYNPRHGPYGDFNGDGKQDAFYSIGYPYTKIMYFHRDEQKHLVHKITNGFNQITQFGYKPITSSSVYMVDDDISTYPESVISFQRPLYVISEIITPDGIGNNNYTYYKYQGSKIHKQGKGFLGFSKVIAEVFIYSDGNKAIGDWFLEKKIISTYELNNTFYYTSLKKIEIFDSGDNLLSEVTYTNSVKNFVEDMRFFPYVSQSVSYDNLRDITTTSNYDYDDFGNLENLTVGYDNVATTETENEYITNGAWCKSRLSKSTITKTRAGEPGAYTRSTDFDYYDNDKGQLKSQINDPSMSKSVTTSYQYNDFGNITEIRTSATGLTDRFTTMEYDNKQRYVTKTTNALDQSVKMDYDHLFGKVAKETGIDELTTYYKYDGFGRLKEIISPDNHKTYISNHWATGGDVPANAVFYKYTQVPGMSDTKVYYDAFGREIKTETEGFNGTVYADKEYDSKGQLYKSSLPYYSGDTPKWTTYYYLFDGRIDYEDYEGLITNYDYTGKTTTITNPAGQSFSKKIDASGKVVEATDMGRTISYDYWPSGQVLNITSLGSNVHIKYDDYGRQEKLIDPDAGEINYIYNAYGELESQTDANDNTYIMEYDELGRLMTKTGPEGTTDYSYYSTGKGIWQLSSVSGPNSILNSYKYNKFGELIQLTENIQGEIFITSFNYDEYGNNTKIIYPSGFGTNKNYDERGFLFEVSRADNGNTVWKLEQMNAQGQPQIYYLGNSQLPDYRTLIQYDSYNFIEHKETYVCGNNVHNMDYNFDIYSGNLDYRRDNRYGLTEDFTYDKNRLQSSSLNGTPVLDMSYYNNGNIEYKSDAGNYKYEGIQTHAVTKIEGNPVNIGNMAQFITYTPFNKVDSIDEYVYQMQFTYGPYRARKKVDSYEYGVFKSTKYYLGNYEKEISGSDTKEIHYIGGVDGLAAVYIIENGIGTLYYVCTDHLGSIVALVDESGTIIEEHSYDAWGRRRNHATWISPATWTYDQEPGLLTRGFTGHEHIDEFGLINMNGRIYDPILGTFLSPDNYVQFADFSQSLNRYSYALNNPLVYVDPDGEIFWVPVLIGAAIGAYSGYTIANAYGYDFTDWQTYGYMVGGAIVGGVSGGIGAEIAAAGGFMSVTSSIVASSYIYSVGMATLSGGMTDLGVSFGVGSYNISQDELGGLWKWSDNTTMENIGYTFGALANVSDVLRGFNSGTIQVQTENNPITGGTDPDLISHTQVLTKDGTSLIDFGPTGDVYKFDPAVNNYVNYSSWGRYSQTIDIPGNKIVVPQYLSGVNLKRLTAISNRLNENPGRFNFLLRSCSQVAARSLTLSGVPVIGIHPYILRLNIALINAGVRPSLFSYYLQQGF